MDFPTDGMVISSLMDCSLVMDEGVCFIQRSKIEKQNIKSVLLEEPEVVTNLCRFWMTTSTC